MLKRDSGGSYLPLTAPAPHGWFQAQETPGAGRWAFAEAEDLGVGGVTIQAPPPAWESPPPPNAQRGALTSHGPQAPYCPPETPEAQPLFVPICAKQDQVSHEGRRGGAPSALAGAA